MTNILLVLIPVFMIAALAVVLLGVLNLASKSGQRTMRSNRLMQLRVLFQFVAVLLMGLLFYLAAG
ncbi:MAG: hypothetical protein Tsb008_03770 [Rhodothalassiaceae bacterium]